MKAYIVTVMIVANEHPSPDTLRWSLGDEAEILEQNVIEIGEYGHNYTIDKLAECRVGKEEGQ